MSLVLFHIYIRPLPAMVVLFGYFRRFSDIFDLFLVILIIFNEYKELEACFKTTDTNMSSRICLEGLKLTIH